MAEGADDSEKTEEPTQRKLDEAHRKGDVPKSQEVSSWFIMVAAALLVGLFLNDAMARLGPTLIHFLSKPDKIIVDGETLHMMAQEIGVNVLLALAVPMLVLMGMALAGNLVQHKLIFSAESMKPKLSKISPLAGAKRLFGPQGLMNFAKGLAKLVVVATVSFLVIWPERETFAALVRADLSIVPVILRELALKLLGGVIAVLTIIAAIDFTFQRMQWTKKQRMTQQEVKDEHKQMEGDPMVKAKLRQLRAERGRQRMMQQVPEASVVVMNPTHFAVALKYEDGMNAPKCVAKGVDNLALKIRELATKSQVPVVENPPLARALYASVEVDQEIPPEHYRAVAQVIGYVMRLKGKLRRRSARS